MTTTTDLWTFPDTVGRLDLSGFDVEATDGSIGKVDEATHDVGESYIVVDTGIWIFGKKRVIPAGVVSAVEHDSKTIFVILTKDQVKAAPDYDAAAWNDESRDRQGDYYRAYQQY
jgi:hypothetical protein